MDKNNSLQKISPANSLKKLSEDPILLKRGLRDLGILPRIEELSESRKLNPEDIDAWFNKGITLYNLNKYKEAIKCFDEAIKINPEDDSAWFYKGEAFYKLGKYDEAKRIDPGNAATWRSKGDALEKLGKHDEAIKCDNCGGYMVLRHGLHGDFYGCTNYPYDHHIIKIEKDSFIKKR
jgi:tetratricopeptide (TPR) repeat protein